MQPLLWMYIILDFICIGFAELNGNMEKNQNENKCIHRESNQRPKLMNKINTWYYSYQTDFLPVSVQLGEAHTNVIKHEIH